MDAFSREYHDLNAAIDEIRDLFHGWSLPDSSDADSSDAGGSPADAPPNGALPPDASPADASPADASSGPPSSGTSSGTPSDRAELNDDRRPSDRPAADDPASDDPAPDVRPQLRYAQLVLHEWLANLSQHATFPGETTSVRIHVRLNTRHVYCAVTDNSQGFDLEAHLDAQTDSAQLLPERGMGLRIVRACTENFSYRQTDDGLHRFEFSIPADHDPWLSTLF